MALISKPPIPGEVGLILGREAEERFLSICEKAVLQKSLPLWFIGAKRGNAEEDSRGIDAWIITMDTLPIPVNIKRSEKTAKRKINRQKKKVVWELENRSTITIIWVQPSDSDEVVLGKIIQMVSKAHENLLQQV